MSGILGTLQGLAGSIGSGYMNILNRIFPPEQRAEVWSKLQTFAVQNPKLAAFLTTQIALSGIPIALFITFTITVFIFSLIAALLIGVLAALVFTAAMVLVALLVVLPTVFMTTFAASFVFLWGLGGYYILKHFSQSGSPAPDGKAIGDKLNNLTGGRMSWLMDGARKKMSGGEEHEEEHEGEKGHYDKKPRKLNSGNGHSNGESNGNPAGDVQKHVENGKDTVTKNVDGVQKRVNKGAGGATNPASNAVGTAKGAVGGVTA